MITKDQVRLLMRAASVLDRKGYTKLATSVTAITIIEELDNSVYDDELEG